jgi:quinolinate synthase
MQKTPQEIAALIEEINFLKKTQNAVILAHTYVKPEIIYGVADFVGDSYGLSKDAMSTKADKIIFVAVRFMAETAKVLNPEKEVLLPTPEDGCTLSDCINATQVRRLRKKYPDYTFVCYINTTVAVKAECDVCVTSANVNKVVSNIPNDKIYFLPDKFMAQNLIQDLHSKGLKKDVKYFNGTCYVHEEFTVQEVEQARQDFPGVKVIAHPECKPEVCQKADLIGSTSQMFDYIKKSPETTFLLLTECGLAARIQHEFPDKMMVGPCRTCKYMKSNTLEEVLRVLKNPTPRDRITIAKRTSQKALKCINAMFQYAEK